MLHWARTYRHVLQSDRTRGIVQQHWRGAIGSGTMIYSLIIERMHMDVFE